jgi:hypothetical protein
MKARIPLIASFLFLQAIASFPAENAPSTTGSKPLALAGLTDGFADALASRPATTVRIGTNEISLESFFAKDFAAAFRCDSVVQAYLDGAGEEADYYMLADAIRKRLMDSLGSFVVVQAEALGDDGSLMRFGIGLSLSKAVAVPVSIRSADERLSTAFILPCTAELEFEAELFVDSRLVNEGKALQGLSLRIKDFSILLRFRPEDLDPSEEFEGEGQMDAASALEALKKVPISYGKKKFILAAAELSLEASVRYRLDKPSGESADIEKYLGPSDEYVEARDILSYEDFSTGNYSWETNESVTIDFPFAQTGKRAKSDQDREDYAFGYSYNDLSDPAEREHLFFNDGIKGAYLEGPATSALKRVK